MITYGIVRRHEDDSMTGMYIRGHAYGSDDGMVCAAVSAIGQTAMAGCGQRDPAMQVRQCRKGHIVFACARTEATEAIISAAIAGLDGVRRQYPNAFSATGRGEANVSGAGDSD